MNTTGKRTNHLFLIHNYNTVPEDLLSYAENYALFDCSDQPGTRETLQKKNICSSEIPNTGHNLTTYFRYFAEHMAELPEVLLLLKGNIFGRHITEEYFAKVFERDFFTFLYQEPSEWGKFSKYDDQKNKNPETGTYLAAENIYCEPNNSWYVESENHPKKYFNDLDDLLKFIYVNPIIPKYLSFSPGGCYILRSSQVRLHGPSFYLNLNKLMDYGIAPHFPSEAHMIERLLPLIWHSPLETNPWMEDLEAFDKKLPECSEYIRWKYENRPRRFGKLRRALGLIH